MKVASFLLSSINSSRCVEKGEVKQELPDYDGINYWTLCEDEESMPVARRRENGNGEVIR